MISSANLLLCVLCVLRGLCVKFFLARIADLCMDTRLYGTLPPLASNTHVENALTLARTGHAIDRSAALLLVKQAPLPDLLRAATSVRACGKGTVVTYSRKGFIPLTTLSRDYCGYCTFRKDTGQPGALFMTPDEVLALADRRRLA